MSRARCSYGFDWPAATVVTETIRAAIVKVRMAETMVMRHARLESSDPVTQVLDDQGISLEPHVESDTLAFGDEHFPAFRCKGRRHHADVVKSPLQPNLEHSLFVGAAG